MSPSGGSDTGSSGSTTKSASLEQVASMVEQGLLHPPTSDSRPVEVEGRLTPFAVTGWDAEPHHPRRVTRLGAFAHQRRVGERALAQAQECN